MALSLHALVRSSSRDADALTGFRKSERARRIAEGRLPPPINLGGRATAFVVQEIEAVNAARAAGATDAEIKALVRELVADRPRRATLARDSVRTEAVREFRPYEATGG